MADGEFDYVSAPMASQWSNLPGDILSAIAKPLSSGIDLLRLRSVCSSWRSSLRPPPKRFSFPLKVPPALHDRDSPPPPRSYYLLRQFTLYRLCPPADPSSGWLIKVSEIKPNTFALLDPLSPLKVKDTEGIIPKHLNLLNYRISEICKSYGLEFVYLVESSEHSRPFVVKKIIAVWNFVAGCDFVVLALHYGGYLSFWKFGDENWTEIDTGHHRFDDLIFCGGKCYAIDGEGVIVYFDPKLNMMEGMGKWVVPLPDQRFYLVDCKSELFRVCKRSYTVDVKTFRLIISYVIRDPNNIGNLEDKILLLGYDVCFSILTKDFAGCKGNCVYLTDNCFYDAGVDSAYGAYTGVYHLDYDELRALVRAHTYAKFFWPPPSWLLSDESSSQG